MFKKGEKIVYGTTGVCIVDDVCEKELIRNQKKMYYVLKPVFQPNNIIYSPVEDGKVFMRPVMTAKEADELILKIPEIRNENSKACLSQEEYRAELSSHSSVDLIKLTAIIYQKKKSANANNKKLGFVDEKYMHLAESLLFGELSVALDIPLDEVQKYIKSKIE